MAVMDVTPTGLVMAGLRRSGTHLFAYLMVCDADQPVFHGYAPGVRASCLAHDKTMRVQHHLQVDVPSQRQRDIALASASLDCDEVDFGSGLRETCADFWRALHE